jgi:hypothetical protein
MKECLHNREMQLDESYMEHPPWGTGITDLTMEMVGNARIHHEALAKGSRMQSSDECAKKDGGGPEASQHSCPMQH